MALLRSSILFAAAALTAASTAPKPHIVMFVIDDLGWHNVGWHNPDMITPHSSKLVAEGIDLDRSYVFYYCAPTRSSLMSGRLPFHVNQVILGNSDRDWDMPGEMTAIPAKLKQAGYATHKVGKWHVGMQNVAQTPHGRGFDTDFGYFDGAEDHWTQANGIDSTDNHPTEPGTGTDVLGQSMVNIALKAGGWDKGNTVDLWCTDRPCWGRNGSSYRMGRNGQVVGDLEHYGDYMYSQEAIRIIGEHDPSVPLYFYIAFQNNHEPLEAPDDYIEMYPASWRQDRRWYAGMTTFWDECIGNVTAKLKEKAMYDNTLIVATTDNGGPTYWVPINSKQGVTYPHGGGANNWPLRGSKVSVWEGGHRGVSFVSGGFLPKKVRGTKLEGYIHVADWYSTFCSLAGVDPADTVTEGTRSDGTKFALPPVDSIDMWAYISGQTTESPRSEIPLAIQPANGLNASALIIGDYKLVIGTAILAYWQGPEFPNGTAPYGQWLEHIARCGNDATMEGGCLYNIRDDPHETTDVASKFPDVLARLKSRFSELAKTALMQHDVVQKNKNCAYATPVRVPGVGTVCPASPEFVAMLKKNKGFVGPYLP